MLGTRAARSSTATPAAGAPRRRRKRNAAARRHIIETQKKRWAEFRKQGGTKATPNRKPVSADVMKKRLAALAKARAARAAKRSGTQLVDDHPFTRGAPAAESAVDRLEKLTGEARIQAVENLRAFFDILARWNREAKPRSEEDRIIAS
jgi:hypothetical protein